MANDLYIKKSELGQDLFDLCIQEYGSVTALFILLEDNPELSIDTVLAQNTEVTFRYEPPLNAVPDKDTMNKMRERGISVNNQVEAPILQDDAVHSSAFPDYLTELY